MCLPELRPVVFWYAVISRPIQMRSRGLVFVDSSHEEMEWRDAAISKQFDPELE